MCDGRTDRQTDGRMDRRTDTPSYRDKRTHLEIWDPAMHRHTLGPLWEKHNGGSFLCSRHNKDKWAMMMDLCQSWVRLRFSQYNHKSIYRRCFCRCWLIKRPIKCLRINLMIVRSVRSSFAQMWRKIMCNRSFRPHVPIGTPHFSLLNIKTQPSKSHVISKTFIMQNWYEIAINTRF